jgi:hypothetical protein
MPVARVRDPERPAHAVQMIGTALVVLRLAEIRENVVITPPDIAELSPEVEVLGLAADVDQAVDRARSAQDLASRSDDLAAVTSRLRLGRVAPVEASVGEQLAKAERDMQPRMPVRGSGLQQQYAVAPRCGEPVGQHASGAAGADDDEVEDFGFPHRNSHGPTTVRGWRMPVPDWPAHVREKWEPVLR